MTKEYSFQVSGGWAIGCGCRVAGFGHRKKGLDIPRRPAYINDMSNKHCPAIPEGYGTNPHDCACGACEPDVPQGQIAPVYISETDLTDAIGESPLPMTDGEYQTMKEGR